ncbi:MAG: ribosome-associated translation inhibitor RaiA [Clostridia bacterium]
MKMIITGKHMDVGEDVRTWAEKKFSKLEKFFRRDSEANITVDSRKRGKHKLDATITYKGMIFRAEVENKDVFAAIDKAVEVIERQIRKNKTRLEKRLHEGAFDQYMVTDDVVEESEIKIVKSKKFAMKPMTPEEAVLQMELVGHSFFVFQDGETEKVCVVYRRKDGNYGLIEPQ